MCTAFIHQGNDLICAFNMDINVEAFKWQVVTEPDSFYVGIRADLPDETFRKTPPPGYADHRGRLLRIQGVNANGVFAVQLNNMGGMGAPFKVSEEAYPLYGIVDQLLTGSLTMEQAEGITRARQIVNMPGNAIDIDEAAMHALICDAGGNMRLIEPGSGTASFTGRYIVLSNFPMLRLPGDLSADRFAYYGFDRYQTANRMLHDADQSFSVNDAFRVLDAVKQTGHWGTRVSFVWSRNEHAVYYTLEHDFSHIMRHVFG